MRTPIAFVAQVLFARTGSRIARADAPCYGARLPPTNVSPPGSGDSMRTSGDIGGFNLRVRHAIQMIHSSFRDPSLRITAIARAVHMSPTHLSRLIKKETGIGFRALCIRLRL